MVVFCNFYISPLFQMSFSLMFTNICMFLTMIVSSVTNAKQCFMIMLLLVTIYILYNLVHKLGCQPRSSR